MGVPPPDTAQLSRTRWPRCVCFGTVFCRPCLQPCGCKDTPCLRADWASLSSRPGGRNGQGSATFGNPRRFRWASGSFFQQICSDERTSPGAEGRAAPNGGHSSWSPRSERPQVMENQPLICRIQRRIGMRRVPQFLGEHEAAVCCSRGAEPATPTQPGAAAKGGPGNPSSCPAGPEGKGGAAGLGASTSTCLPVII